MVIQDYRFGKIKIDDITYTTDVKISPEGMVIPQWWRKRGHRVEIDDVKDILTDEVRILVLGKGKPGLMKASTELKQYLETRNITLVEEASSKAVQRVNKLFSDGIKCAAGFHLTC